MADDPTQISVKGRQSKVSSIAIDDVNVITYGKWLKIASVKDEDYCEGEPVADPERMIAQFKEKRGRADLFSFIQRLPDVSPKFKYPMLSDNLAAIPITNYTQWWDSLSQDTRRNVRLCGKRGAVVQGVPYTDELVRGIAGIYNETPFRQGRRFWHYGKDFETVKRENGTYVDRSQFIAAYHGTELIGFIKMVYINKLASIMQILSRAGHQDKRPTNALIAKAVELCAEKGVSHLLYCKYVYHKNYHDALTEFKRRNKFQQYNFPRYFVPLTLKGRLAVRFKLQSGLTQILPQGVLVALLKARSRYNESRAGEKIGANETAAAGVGKPGSTQA